jgi:hypothetical protein
MIPQQQDLNVAMPIIYEREIPLVASSTEEYGTVSSRERRNLKNSSFDDVASKIEHVKNVFFFFEGDAATCIFV